MKFDFFLIYIFLEFAIFESKHYNLIFQLKKSVLKSDETASLHLDLPPFNQQPKNRTKSLILHFFFFNNLLNIFCHSFQKVKPIYYIDSLHRVKYFKPLFLEIWMIIAYK